MQEEGCGRGRIDGWGSGEGGVGGWGSGRELYQWVDQDLFEEECPGQLVWALQLHAHPSVCSELPWNNIATTRSVTAAVIRLGTIAYIFLLERPGLKLDESKN